MVLLFSLCFLEERHWTPDAPQELGCYHLVIVKPTLVSVGVVRDSSWHLGNLSS